VRIVISSIIHGLRPLPQNIRPELRAVNVLRPIDDFGDVIRCYYTVPICRGGGAYPLFAHPNRSTMTAVIIDFGIGSGIFGFPSELTRLLGFASAIAMLVGGQVW
jgi:hypothetical protein